MISSLELSGRQRSASPNSKRIWGHFAEVTVRASTSRSSGFELRISPLAFDWLKEVYGPGAWEWAQCAAFRGGALRGVAYALQHTTSGIDWRLAIDVYPFAQRQRTPQPTTSPSLPASLLGRHAA